MDNVRKCCYPHHLAQRALSIHKCVAAACDKWRPHHLSNFCPATVSNISRPFPMYTSSHPFLPKFQTPKTKLNIQLSHSQPHPHAGKHGSVQFAKLVSPIPFLSPIGYKKRHQQVRQDSPLLVGSSTQRHLGSGKDGNAQKHVSTLSSSLHSNTTSHYFFSPRIALKTQVESAIAYHELLICRALPNHDGFVKLVQWTKDKTNEEMTMILEKGECTVYDMFVREYKNKVPLNILKQVLFQILYTLWYGQHTCEFVHNDLHLKNVLMKRVKGDCVFTTSTKHTGGIQRSDVAVSSRRDHSVSSLPPEVSDSPTSAVSTARRVVRRRRRSPLAELNDDNVEKCNRDTEMQKEIQKNKRKYSQTTTTPQKPVKPEWFGSCWRTDINYMTKLADFGSSRITLPDGSVLCIPPHSEIFDPHHDLDRLATAIKRIQPGKDTPKEERKMYLSLKKQMGSIGCQVEQLLEHAFFDSLRYDPAEEERHSNQEIQNAVLKQEKHTLHFGLNPITPIVFRNNKRVHPASPAIRKRIRRKVVTRAAWSSVR